jgi:NitT/TauT family transport system substrate-binding protein
MEEAWNSAVEAINDEPESYRGLLVEKASLPEPIADSYAISDYPETEMPDAALVTDMLSWMKDKGYLTADITYNGEDGTFQGR